MSWVAAWIEGTNSSGARELNNPTDAQSKMSNLSKCTVRKWAKRIAVIPMSTEDRWAGCQGAKLGNKELEDSVSIWRDGTCVSGPCGYRSRAWLREWGVAAWVCLLPTSRKPELQLGGGGVQSVCPVATVIDICGDSLAESPWTKFACIACLLMLSECSNYGTFCFQGQNLTQSSWRCVIVMIHGSFREPEGRKAGLMRNESRNGNIFRTWSNYSLRIYLVLFLYFLWRM